MEKTAWYDVEMRGRRMEAISKHMNTKFWNCVKEKDEKDNKLEPNIPLAFAYLDRLLKIENSIQPYIEQITGVKQLIKKGHKVAPDISR